MRILVGGYLGLLPAGGVTWDYIQYVLGFARLGHDVYYIEDTGLWPIFQNIPESGINCDTNVRYLADVMRDFGLADRWAYRDEVSGEWFGMSAERVHRLLSTADMSVNVSCANQTRDDFMTIPLRVLIDSDPMFTQIQYRDSMAFAKGTPGMRRTVASHTHFFSFGERIGRPDCRVPDIGVTWQPTRQPVCTWLWPVTSAPKQPRFTTVMNWTASRSFEYEGEDWGQKDVEFARIIDLPKKIPGASLEMTITRTGGSEGFPADIVEAAGWKILDPADKAGNWRSYQKFLQHSSGEFSVAKEAYVKGKTGWFSGRSACYLASGRPVVTQDTGWSEIIPAGRGLFAFNTEADAMEAIETVLTDPVSHGNAATEIAHEYFDSSRVLSSLLERVTA